MSAPLAERFWAKVLPEPNSGCWLWTGALTNRGYGNISVGRKRFKPATHVSLALHERHVPEGLFALHRCDNRLCVNPEHLFVGSAADNKHDAMRKGRASPPPLNQGPRSHKEFCHLGHRLEGDNYRLCADGKRRCHECAKLRKKQRRLKWRVALD